MAAEPMMSNAELAAAWAELAHTMARMAAVAREVALAYHRAHATPCTEVRACRH